ncbi:MAG: hypothetical protein J0M34_00720 [Alphaproteobacteria bacterium]|nr:hypothetical protein [Alphaproteobacteria bacterium]
MTTVTQHPDHNRRDDDDPVIREWLKIKHELTDYRQSTLQFLHPLVVNNTASIVAGMEVAAELAMFKSNGKILVPADKKGNLINYVIEPAKSVMSVVFGDAKFTTNPGEKWYQALRPDKLWDRLTDLEAAAKRELPNALKNLDPKTGAPKFVNRWQARATASSIIPFALVSILPNPTDEEKDVEAMTEMAVRNPVGYVGTRFVQAINPFGWGDHKRQLAGLAKIAAGAFTVIAGFRNPRVNGFGANPAHAIGGTITALAGAQLMLAVDNQSGWSQYGSTLWARMFVLPNSIMNRYTNGDPNANWYSLAHATFQTSNTVAFLAGGAEKKDDGTIVDHAETKKEAKQKALEEKRRKKEEREGKHTEDSPAHSVSETKHVSRVSEEKSVQRHSV